MFLGYCTRVNNVFYWLYNIDNEWFKQIMQIEY
jgi:hypothetical protein